MMKLAVTLMLIATAAAQDKAVVLFYGESLCPDCFRAVRFIRDNVFDKAHDGILDIMDFQYVAWGNAHRKNGGVTCQHGPAECLGNMVEECARDQTAYNVPKYWPFVECLELDSKTIDDNTIASCAATTGLDGADLSACLTDGRGDALIAAAEQATPDHPGVPYITLNGVVMDNYKTMVDDVCAYWTGAKPSFCTKATKFGQDKAMVRFYGESLCPYCKQAVSFLRGNVFDEAHEGILDIMDFQYVAWGNARRQGDSVACQHGPAECLGNMVEECARNQTAYAVPKYMPFVECLELDSKTIDDNTIASCAATTGLDGADLSACLTDGRGDALIAAAERATPDHPGVPYFEFNGKSMNDYTTLVKDVCAYWTGAKPAFCVKNMRGQSMNNW